MWEMLAWGISEPFLQLHLKKINNSLSWNKKKEKAVWRWCDPINATLIVRLFSCVKNCLVGSAGIGGDKDRVKVREKEREWVKERERDRASERESDTVSGLVGMQPNFTASRMSATAYGCNLCDSLCVSPHISVDIPSQIPYWSNIMSNTGSAWLHYLHNTHTACLLRR